MVLAQMEMSSRAQLVELTVRIDAASIGRAEDPAKVARDAMQKSVALVALRDGDPSEFDNFIAEKSALDDVLGLYKALSASGYMEQRQRLSPFANPDPEP